MRTLVSITLSLLATTAMAIDLVPLWDFGMPELSEQRFGAALQAASGDDRLILQTQIARTYGLRKNFESARAMLKALEPQIAGAGPEARSRYFLELGRTYASATHPTDSLTAEGKQSARVAYQAALDAAKLGGLDSLAIDAIHMFAFIDTAPDEQLKWRNAALAVVESSTQPDAMRWEASVRNNIGYAMHQLGRYEEALDQFQKAVIIRERGNIDEATRTARWMVAWTLRALKRTEEALDIQLRLERERDAAGQADPHVFDELEHLFSGKGNTERAAYYAARRRAISK